MQTLSSPELQPITPSFLEYLKVLRKQKWVVLLCLIGVVVPFVLVNEFSTRIYEAEATIIYEEPNDTMLALNIGQSSYNKSALNNMIELLMSRSLYKEVAGALPGEIIRTFEEINVVATRGSDILRIKVQASDPAAAQTIADAYVDQIIQWNLRKKREEISNVRDFVEKQLTIFEDKLNAAEEALRAFKEENRMITLNDASIELLRRMTQAEVAYNDIKAERAALEQRQRFIAQKKNQLAPALAVSSSPLAQQLKQKLLELETRFSEYQIKGYSEQQPEMITLEKNIAEAKQKLIQELVTTAQKDNLIDPLSQIRTLLHEAITVEVDLETAKAREAGLQHIIADYDAEFQTLPQKELELARLIQAGEVNDRIYSMLLTKREEARITEAGKIGDVRAIDAAEKPKSPIKPNKKRNLAMGIMLGLALGIGLAFFLESLDTSLKSEEDLKKYVSLPVLASIPSINMNGAILFKKNYKHTTKSYSRKLISHLNRSSPVYDAFRALQINFAFVNTDRVFKSILMTSAGPGDGKTLIAINMAQVFAGSGVKTMLIDCDLRRPMIHQVFNLSRVPGLTDVLINNAALGQAIHKVENMSLHVLPCGTQPPNPSEILDSARMRQLLAQAKSEYDLVILDSPPLLAVTDALVLCTAVDGVCLVIKSGRTSQDMALRAKQMLENSRTRIIGTILNDIDLRKEYRYYKDYYYSDNGGKETIN